MTNEEIHNIYLHMSGKAEGIAEATGTADFPVLFARAILEFNRMERSWVGLTDEEIEHIEETTTCYGEESWLRNLTRNIEAKLKEKNA